MNFKQNALGDFGFRRRQTQLRKEFMTLLDRHAAHVGDILAVNEDVTSLLPQPRTAALRTNGISAIAAQEYPYVQLVFFRFQVFEKFPNGIHHKRLLF